MNWKKITSKMVDQYGSLTKKGFHLHTLSILCEIAEKAEARRADGYEDGEPKVWYDDYNGIGLMGQIPPCMEHGTDFCQEGMRSRLKGMENAFPGLVYALTTHDLNSFKIPHIGNLVTEIRMGN